MSGYARMNEIYGDRWPTLMPPAGRGIIATSNVLLDAVTGGQYNQEICRIKVEPNEFLVIQKYGCIVLQTGANDEWVGLEPKQVSPYALQGRATWDVVINTQQPTGERRVSLGGVTFNHGVPVPPTPNAMSGLPFFREYGYQCGDAPLIAAPGETVSLMIFTFGNNGSALTPPPLEYPLTFVGTLSGYRLPSYPAATIPQGQHRP